MITALKTLPKTDERKRMFDKRGSLTDVLVVLVIIGFATALGFVIAYKVYNSYYDAAAPMLNSSNYSISALDSLHGKESTFDGLFMSVIIGLTLVGYVLAFMTRESPIFIFIDILVILVLIVIGALVANAYQAMEADPEMASTMAAFPYQHFFFNNLPVLMTVAIFGMIIVMFFMGSSEGAF